ncbi:unnamed protein product [Anisakis simplex]|uniref:Uncharacterized protein n=1 Tax=Anisakis simplex TaxID=6269 RepID=A0A0M3J859_ANISI|nr:unnamed protein product [Anisakis simplex]
MDLTRRSIQSTIDSDSDASSSTKNDCVQLIQACDSLTTVPPNAMIRTFAPSKVSDAFVYFCLNPSSGDRSQ